MAAGILARGWGNMTEIESIDDNAIDAEMLKIRALIDHVKKIEPDVNAEAAILFVLAALQPGVTKWKVQQ